MTWSRFALGAAVESLLLGLMLVWPNSRPPSPPVAQRKVISLTAPVPLPALPPPPPRPRPLREAPTQASLPQPLQTAAVPAPQPPPPPLPTPPIAPVPSPPVTTPELAPSPKPVVGLFDSVAAEAPKPARRIVETAFAEPAPVSGGRSRAAVVSSALDSPLAAPAARSRAPLNSTSFEIAAADPQRNRGVVVQTSALESEPATAPARRLAVQEGAFRPVEILSRPKPAYTQSARESGIEGEVILKVKFLASGRLEVLQILRGLGHGLDENAALAAGQLQFRPAERDGRPVDQLATLRIQFLLAQ